MKRIFTPAYVLILLVIMFFSCTDTSELENQIDNIENRVAALEKLTAQMNTNISALQSAVTALQNNDYVTNISEIKEGDAIIGYTLTFVKSGAVTIYNGKDGTNGKDGISPVIGVKLFTDGFYYWTLNGFWLTDTYGNKIKAQGTDGKNGITPQLKIENEYWMLSTDNGITWKNLGKAKGEDGDDFFQSVTQDEHNVYIILIDGTEIIIPKNEKLSILFDSSDLINISAGETKTLSYTITSTAENVNIETFEQKGWSVKLTKTTSKTGTMSITAPIPISDGKIMVVLTDNYDNCYIKTITMIGVGSYITTVLDTYTAQSTSGQFTVNVNTNTEYTVLIPEEAQSWLSVDSKGSILVFSLQTNTTYDDRSTKVMLVGIDGVTTSEFTLTQLQKDAIILSDTEYNITYTMQNVEIVLQSNVDVVVNIPAESPWISHSSTRALTKRIVTLRIEENGGAESRTGNITITDTKKNISKNITVTQDGAKAMVSITSGVANMKLPRAGELNKTLVDNTIDPNLISTLIISGRINGTDIATIRGMSTLNNLDIKNASIVSGGNAYYDVNYTTNDVVGKYMFSSLTNLQAIILPSNITTLEAFAFDNCTSLTSIDIPDSVISIGENAFFSCSKLTSIELPINITIISKQMFGDCTSLTKVVMNSNVTTIGAYAFANCTNLTDINIPTKVTTFGDYAFANCNNISKLTLSSNVTSVGRNSFSGCGGDITINCKIPDRSSANGCFYGAHFKSVSFGYSVTAIGAFAFERCNKLEQINFPSSIVSIGSYAFLNCSGVKTITIPSSVTSIGSYAFSGCTGSANINCNISSFAFSNSNISEAIIGGNAITIGQNAFWTCSGLTKVTIGNSVKTVGISAFNGCSVLNDVSIGSSVVSIGDNAFSYCKSLSNIIIPESVTYIGREAFYASALSSVYCKPTIPPTLASSSFFSNNNSDLKIYVPTASVEAYKKNWIWHQAIIQGYTF